MATTSHNATSVLRLFIFFFFSPIVALPSFSSNSEKLNLKEQCLRHKDMLRRQREQINSTSVFTGVKLGGSCEKAKQKPLQMSIFILFHFLECLIT